MLFNLQLFSSGGMPGRSDGGWYFLTHEDSIHSSSGLETWFCIPDGEWIWREDPDIDRRALDYDSYPDGSTFAITNVYSASGDSSTVTVTCDNPADITVYDSGTVNNTTLSGTGDKTNLTVIIDGVAYPVNSSGKLVLPAVPIAANAWYQLFSDPTTFGWLATASTTQNDGFLDDADSNVTIWVTGLSAISGNATAATATLASGKNVGNIAVSGSNADSLTLTIAGTAYYVNASGGLSADWLTKADASNTYLKKSDASSTYLTKTAANDYLKKTDASSAYLTKTDAADAYLGKSDTAAHAATADRLTTGRAINILDNSGVNRGTGTTFTGGVNITLKMPANAIFSQLTATNLVLGTTTSTVEGALWLDWS